MKFIQSCTLIMLLMKFKRCNKMEAFIVGAENTKIDKFPHAVYLELSTSRKWICGSAILNQDVIITAAHCLFTCADTKCNINALAGHECLYKATIVREINDFKIHGKYDDVDMENDIALAKVTESFPLGGEFHIKRIMVLETFPNVVIGKMAGWGVTDDETKEAAVTLKMTLQVLKTQDECQQYVEMNPGLLCAATPTKLGRPSEGDSGSALVTTSFAQIGVVSFRMEDNPSILYYTNVTYFHNWIQEATQALYCFYDETRFYI